MSLYFCISHAVQIQEMIALFPPPYYYRVFSGNEVPRLQNSVLCPLKIHEYICDSRPPADLVVHDSKNAQPSAFLNVQVSKIHSIFEGSK